jgi:hypothetical protein
MEEKQADEVLLGPARADHHLQWQLKADAHRNSVDSAMSDVYQNLQNRHLFHGMPWGVTLGYWFSGSTTANELTASMTRTSYGPAS